MHCGKYFLHAALTRKAARPVPKCYPSQILKNIREWPPSHVRQLCNNIDIALLFMRLANRHPPFTPERAIQQGHFTLSPRQFLNFDQVRGGQVRGHIVKYVSPQLIFTQTVSKWFLNIVQLKFLSCAVAASPPALCSPSRPVVAALPTLSGNACPTATA